jgi:hypothetical protein
LKYIPFDSDDAQKFKRVAVSCVFFFIHVGVLSFTFEIGAIKVTLVKGNLIL